MVHFTCDLCGKDLGAGEPRFVVKIAAYPGFDPDQITEDDLDEDHMEAVAEVLRSEQNQGTGSSQEEGYRGFRYDLCPSCHQKFLKDPLGKDLIRSFDLSDFSNN
ncbi:hypothetical protein [Tautonia sociabilis]|uniref:Uncharacterized protein n=1 Tax=Tautonia sociabilis TaxID=2080755 RepID=A0A432MGH8_9BACT|nr:hypothetical protein [Tautonia sociabilis]RUL85823.1 hypothetical protein TsocGM_17535 [Tautonia sociabilis]